MKLITLNKLLRVLLIRLVLILVISLAFLNSVNAITYFVSNAGNDNNDGMTPASTWASLDKVNSFTFSPGDIISFKGGDKFIGSIYKFLQYDNPKDFLVFNSYGNGKAIIECRDTTTICIKVQFTKRAAISINDLIIRGKYNAKLQKGGAKTSAGINIYGQYSPVITGESNIIIKNCEISSFRSGGISIVSGDFERVLNTTIDSNRIHDCGNMGISCNFLWYSNSIIKNNIIYDLYGIQEKGFKYSGIGIQLSLCKKIICERNLIYNLGEYADISGLGIVTGASKNIIIRKCEIYNIHNNNGHDGEAIDFENGSDSCTAEYNYLHDLEGVGALISGSSELSVKNCKISNMTNMDYSCGDYNVIRYNIFKECGIKNSLMSVKIGSGNRKFPATNNLIYNNTIVKKKTGDNFVIALTSPQKKTGIFNNIILTDRVTFFLVDRMDTKSGLKLLNNCFYDINDNSKQIVISNGNNYNVFDLDSWIGDFNLEISTGVKASMNVNPMLKDPFTHFNLVNNAFKIDTMSAYKLLDGSPMINNGADLKYFFGIDRGSYDFYGVDLKTIAAFDIGASEFVK